MAEENIQTNAPEQDLSEILKVRREKLAALRAEGRDPFKETRFDVTHHAQDIKDNFDALEGSEVRVAGRLMSKRGMGKVSFCDLQDKSGRIKLYPGKDENNTYSKNELYAAHLACRVTVQDVKSGRELPEYKVVGSQELSRMQELCSRLC